MKDKFTKNALLISTNIREVMYAPDTEELRIRFTNGSSYDYEKVPEKIYDGLLASQSAGKYFHENIKTKYKFRRV